MPTSLVDRRVLITGGTRGIGAAIATEFLKAGAQVLAAGRDVSHFKKLEGTLGAEDRARLQFSQIDLSHRSETESWAEKLKSERIDILVNNAGINKISLVGEISAEDYDRIQEVNVRAPMLLSRALVPLMAERGWGRVVNLTSVFGVVTKSQRASYSTSKFALLGLTKSTAVDYASRGVLCNAVAPGFIDTELTRTVLSEKEIETMTAQVPMRRLGLPTEVAKLVLFLASPENTFITGQNLIIDGGFTSV